MSKTTAVIRALIGLALILLVAAPSSAQTGSSHVLAASGVTFIPSPDQLVEFTATHAVAPLRFHTPMTTANAVGFRQEPEKHIFGAGLRTGGYGLGIGALVRYWFTQQLFIDASISHYGYSGFTGFGQNTVMGSLLYMFKKIDTNDAIVFRIYAGGGINISTSRYDDGLTEEKDTLVGGQGLAGVEMIVKQLPQLGFGLEVGVYSGNDLFYAPAGIGGFGTTIYAVWYFK